MKICTLCGREFYCLLNINCKNWKNTDCLCNKCNPPINAYNKYCKETFISEKEKVIFT